MGKTRTTKQSQLGGHVDFSRLVPVEKISGDSKEDTRLLRKMATEAREYLLSFKWCKKVCRAWFGWGVGGVCAVFLFEIEPDSEKVDRLLWVIVGDLPPAYLVTDASPTPLTALHNYADLMQEWVDAVRRGRPVDDCIPVNAPATLQYADLLR